MRGGSRIALVAAGAAIAVALAGCGEKEETPTAPASRASSTLALDFYVNPDHAGIYRRSSAATSPRPGSTWSPGCPPTPRRRSARSRPAGPTSAISYEPEVLLARDQGLPVKAVGALVPQPLTSLISLPEGGIEEPADLARQDDRDRGDPVPDGLPRGDPRRARPIAAPTSSRWTSASACCRPCSPAAPTRCSAASATSRASTSSCAARTRGSCPVDELGIPTYDELVLVANDGPPRGGPRGDPPLHRRARARDRRRGRRPRGRDGRGPRRRRRARAEADRRRDRGHPAAAPAARTASSRSATWTRSEWERFVAFMADKGLIARRPPTDEVLTNELLPRPEPTPMIPRARSGL